MTATHFTHLFNSSSGYLKGFALKLTKDINFADDLFQETAFRAFKNRDKFKPGTNIRAWLSTIMKNIFINSFRKKKQYQHLQDTTKENYMLNSSSTVIENDGEWNVQLEELSGIIDELKDGLKIPFLMVYQGYHYEEISKHMGLPLGTVKSRIFLARKELKNKIAHLY